MALEDQLVVVGYRKVEASFKRVGDDLLEGVLMNFGELGFKESAFRGWGITGKEVDFAFIKQTFNIKIIKFQNKFILTVAKTILYLSAIAVRLQRMAERFKDEPIQVVHRPQSTIKTALNGSYLCKTCAFEELYYSVNLHHEILYRYSQFKSNQGSKRFRHP
jgi:hypothetical protein